MKRRSRAFLLIMVLLITLILLVAGFGFLGKRVGQYRSTVARNNAFQAKWLAQAGMQDARSKLAKDYNFPPQGASTQLVFAYAENVTAPDGSGAVVGSFQVTVDQTYAEETYATCIVTSVGILGDPTQPLQSPARHKIVGELDISPYVRVITPNPIPAGWSPPPNPNLWHWINWTDYAGF